MALLDRGLIAARYRYAVLRLFGLQLEPAEATAIQDIICPAETMASRPAVCLPGQIEKIQGVPFGRKEDAVNAALGHERHWGPTIRYEIADATLLDGSIYWGRSRLFRADRRTISGAKDVVHLDEAVLLSSLQGCHYFGHWVMDDCSTYELAREFGAPVSPSIRAKSSI